MICDLDFEDCKNSVESNITLLEHTCKLDRNPKRCVHYCFKKKISCSPDKLYDQTPENT